jgi:hypothetical protein
MIKYSWDLLQLQSSHHLPENSGIRAQCMLLTFTSYFLSVPEGNPYPVVLSEVYCFSNPWFLDARKLLSVVGWYVWNIEV